MKSQWPIIFWILICLCFELSKFFIVLSIDIVQIDLLYNSHSCLIFLFFTEFSQNIAVIVDLIKSSNENMQLWKNTFVFFLHTMSPHTNQDFHNGYHMCKLFILYFFFIPFWKIPGFEFDSGSVDLLHEDTTPCTYGFSLNKFQSNLK